MNESSEWDLILKMRKFDKIGGLGDRLFEQKKTNKKKYYFFSICVCVFCGECGWICMISICVADNSYKAIFSLFFLTQIILIVFLVVK